MGRSGDNDKDDGEMGGSGDRETRIKQIGGWGDGEEDGEIGSAEASKGKECGRKGSEKQWTKGAVIEHPFLKEKTAILKIA